MATDATDFGVWFQETFGAAFPVQLDEPLTHLRDEIWVSPGLYGAALAVPMNPRWDEPSGDYRLAGFWGHSVNSYALYLIERRGEHRCFFRLPYGGAYGDPARDAARAVRFLAGYQAFTAAHLPLLQSSDLKHEMGAGAAQLVTRQGRAVTLEDPPGADIDGFWQRLEGLLRDA